MFIWKNNSRYSYLLYTNTDSLVFEFKKQIEQRNQKRAECGIDAKEHRTCSNNVLKILTHHIA